MLARLSGKRGAEVKASLNRAQVSNLRPETTVIYAWPGRSSGKNEWRAEPVHVEKCWDELRIGVKCQSNVEIAGSPRNSFRASLRECMQTVEH